MLTIRCMNYNDYENFSEIVKETESTFGAQLIYPEFFANFVNKCEEKSALCIEELDKEIAGAVIFNYSTKEIDWLAVKKKHYKKGYGSLLLKSAISKLHTDKIFVTTFSKTEKVGKPARNLYTKFGFIDYQEVGVNPVGYKISTLILKKSNI